MGMTETIQNAIFAAGLSLQRRLAGLRAGTLRCEAGRIAYLERAGSGEAVVLLHGFAANKDVWLPLVWHMRGPWRLVLPDLPGHGDSDFDAGRRYGGNQLAVDALSALTALGIERFHLVGSSLGGLVATLMAVREPQRVTSLTLFNPAGVYPPVPSEFQNLLERGDNPLLVSSRADFDRLMGFVFARAPWIPWPVRSVLTRLDIARAGIHARIWEDLYADFRDVRELLPALTMPVLLVWGDRDRVLHVSSVEVYRAAVPRLQVVILENCGHTPMIERARESARRFVGFLEQSQGR